MVAAAARMTAAPHSAAPRRARAGAPAMIAVDGAVAVVRHHGCPFPAVVPAAVRPTVWCQKFRMQTPSVRVGAGAEIGTA